MGVEVGDARTLEKGGVGLVVVVLGVGEVGEKGVEWRVGDGGEVQFVEIGEGEFDSGF